MPSVRSLFLGFHSLVEDVGNCKVFRVFALKVQVIDCNITHTVSGCGLCSEIIHSVWCMAATSFWFHLRKKKNLPVEIVFFSFFFLPSHYLMSNSIFSKFSAIIQPYSLKRDVFCDLFIGCMNALLTIILYWNALIIYIPVLMCHNQDLSLHFFKPFISVSIQEAYEACKKQNTGK